jgi:hypothetical protein
LPKSTTDRLRKKVEDAASERADSPRARTFRQEMFSKVLLSFLVLASSIALPATSRGHAQISETRRLPTRIEGRPQIVADSVSASAARPAASSTIMLDPARIRRALGGSATNIRVTGADGVTDVRRSGDAIPFKPTSLVFGKVADTARIVATSAVNVAGAVGPQASITADAVTYKLPYRWLSVDSAGIERVLVPFFIVRGGGLTYDVMRRRYTGTALVGVEDTLNPGAGRVQLPSPVQLMLATTRGGTVSRGDLTVGHTSLEYDTVTIESPDSTSILLRTAADLRGITIAVPVRAIVASLIPDQKSIEGLGLSTTTISVSLPRGLSRKDTALLTFASTGAPVKPSLLRLAAGDIGTLKLRSGMPGPDSIRAYLDGVPVAETVVMVTPPWGFLQAMILGILIGGTARWATKRRRKLKVLAWDVFRAAPFGFLTAAALTLGIKLVPVEIEDSGAWIAVLFITALGSWAGSAVLEKFMPAATA